MKFLTVIFIFCVTFLAVAQANFDSDDIQQRWQFSNGNRRDLFRNGQRRGFQRYPYGRRPYNRFVIPLLPLPFDVDNQPDVTIPSQTEMVIRPVPQITPGPVQEATLVEAVVGGTPLEATATIEAAREPDVKVPEEETKSTDADVAVKVAESDSQ